MNRMRGYRAPIAILAATAFLALAGCEEEGPAEKVGEKVDKAAESVSEAVEEAGEKAKEAAQ